MAKVLVASHAAVLNVNRALFQQLRARGQHDVSMIVPRRWRGDLIRELCFEPTHDDSGMRIFELPVYCSGSGSLFFYRANLRRILREAAPDLLLVDEEPWSLSAGQFCLSAPEQLKIAFYTKQNLKKNIPLPFRMLERWVFKKSVAAFSVEPEVSEVLRWKGYKKKIFDLPHSFDPHLFQKLNSPERESLRQKLGLHPTRPLIFYCGRLTEEKGIRDLIRVITNLDELQFLIVGNGPLFPELEQLGRSRKNFRCIAALPHAQIGRTMASADILVLPSRTTAAWKEQFGRVLVEGMACGCAVVGSDSGAIGRVIERTKGGLVFPEGDADMLAKSILELTDNPGKLRDFQEKGHSYVQRELTHLAMAGRLEAAITEFLHS